jgi:hypothetical protein
LRGPVAFKTDENRQLFWQRDESNEEEREGRLRALEFLRREPPYLPAAPQLAAEFELAQAKKNCRKLKYK